MIVSTLEPNACDSLSPVWRASQLSQLYVAPSLEDVRVAGTARVGERGDERARLGSAPFSAVSRYPNVDTPIEVFSCTT